jgi:insulysin
MEISQSPNDDREYKFFKLDNNLRVICVSDKETTQSSACLQVQVGAGLDPDEYSGLAHFLEHMLFMGTEKYPEEDAYSQHCSNYSGYDNAYTGLEMTNYHFEVNNEGFEKALDMFAQFFICPLFSKSSVDREMNAVDSENKKNLQSDMWRYYQLLQNESNPESTLNRFATGNLETLKKDGVVEALKEFHKKWYSANIMNLVVYANKSLDDIEKLVRELFSAVEDKSVTVPSFEEPPSYPPERLGYLYFVKPVLNKDTLKFNWFYSNHSRDYYQKILDIVSHVIGHEGENSLLSYLKNEDLAVELSSYSDHMLNAFSYFSCTITLTKKGLKDYERVIEIVSKITQNLIEEGPLEHVYDECSKLGNLRWEFLEKSNAVNTAVSLASRMNLFEDENMKDLYSTRYLYKEFAKDRYHEALKKLVPEN